MSTVPPDASRQYGAAMEYIIKLYGGVMNDQNKTVSVGTSRTALVGFMADRIALIVSNVGAGLVTINPQAGDFGVLNGIQIPSGGLAFIHAKWDGTFVTRGFDAQSDASGPYTVFVSEIFRFRKLS